MTDTKRGAGDGSHSDSGIRKRESHTRLTAASDPLRQGPLFVLDPCQDRLDLVSQEWSEVSSVDILGVLSIEAMKQRLRKPRDGRPRVRGFFVQWSLDRTRPSDVIDAIAELRRSYPRTPLCVFGQPASIAIDRDLHPQARFVTAAELSASALPSIPVLREALLGKLFLHPSCRGISVLHEGHIGSELLRMCDNLFFQPWDELCRRIRGWLLGRVIAGQTLEEYHLRTLDAYFESVVDPAKLAYARGVDPRTLDQYMKELRRVFGVELPSLKADWDIKHFDQGAPHRAVPLVARPPAFTPANPILRSSIKWPNR